jgi:hypothetical protein
MWKKSLLLAFLLCLAGPAAFACGPAVEPPQPPTDAWLLKDYVKKIITLDAHGKLTVAYFRCLGPDGKPLVVVSLTAGGKTYHLDFAAAKELLETAKQLDGGTARVVGTPDGSALRVTKLEAGSGDAVQETVAVELRGTLRIEPWTIPLCPVPRGSEGWRFFQKVEVTSEGKVYALDLGDRDNQWQVAEKADGGAVVVTGTLVDGRVIVSSISPAPEFHFLEPVPGGPNPASNPHAGGLSEGARSVRHSAGASSRRCWRWSVQASKGEVTRQPDNPTQP